MRTVPLKIDVGKYELLTSEDYHEHTSSISRSAIMEFDRSPKKYWANYLNPYRPDKKSTQAMLFGEAFHKMMLESEKFGYEFCVEREKNILPKIGLLRDLGREEFDRQKLERANAEKNEEEQRLRWERSNSDKKILTRDEMKCLEEMKTAIQEHKEALDLITDGKYEHSYFWEDKDSGLIVKARPDILHGSMVVDLKTCRDSSPKAFQRAMCDGGYHIQAAMILDAVRAIDNREIVTFINIAIEKEYPYSIGIYIIDDAAIGAGRERYKNILLKMKEARESGVYSDYETQVIGLPTWYE